MYWRMICGSLRNPSSHPNLPRISPAFIARSLCVAGQRAFAARNQGGSDGISGVCAKMAWSSSRRTHTTQSLSVTTGCWQLVPIAMITFYSWLKKWTILRTAMSVSILFLEYWELRIQIVPWIDSSASGFQWKMNKNNHLGQIIQKLTISYHILPLPATTLLWGAGAAWTKPSMSLVQCAGPVSCDVLALHWYL